MSDNNIVEINRNKMVDHINNEANERKKRVSLASCLERLKDNSDFKELFEEYLFKENAARVVRCMADPQVVTNEQVKTAYTNEMIMIGELQMTMKAIASSKQEAESYLAQSDDMIEEIYQGLHDHQFSGED